MTALSSAEPIQSFGPTFEATLIDRPNRFLVRAQRGTELIEAFLPNPGRLWELLMPGVALRIEEAALGPRRTRHTVVAVERGGRPILLHTHRANDLAAELIAKGAIPGLEGARVLRREVTCGRSRFDMLLSTAQGEMLLEVKSCTLVERGVAMFPDAVTERGRRHLEELAQNPLPGAVLFLINHAEARWFMPNYHRDPAFAQALLEVRHRIGVFTASLAVNPDLTVEPQARAVPILWDMVERENQDRGAYLLIVAVPEELTLDVGALGRLDLAPGTYVYVGSAMRGLEARVARHLRRTKRQHWHIDALLARTARPQSIIIRSSRRDECALAQALSALADGAVPRFGSSDCSCHSHLLWFRRPPLQSQAFHSALTVFTHRVEG